MEYTYETHIVVCLILGVLGYITGHSNWCILEEAAFLDEECVKAGVIVGLCYFLYAALFFATIPITLAVGLGLGGAKLVMLIYSKWFEEK